ncbi:MAG: glucosamine-6-phosphate deaminase [Firmicutes bacterium]|jgi:glucosamine-6-phosphate deaminase|nr:glucosamine-6-phosphate deaminase [Bacillota bacterium]
MEIYVVDNYKVLSTRAALIVAGQICAKADTVLGLATGSTPLGMYRELTEMHKKDGLDFSRVVSFNLDEYLGLAPDNVQSYHYFMWENFFKYINIRPENTHIPDGLAADTEAACVQYEQALQRAGGVDLQILGIGRNGHIGFNEPSTRFTGPTHVVRLSDDTIKANARFFASMEEVPTHAITMGIKTIMQAKKILLLANGKEKAQAIKAAVCGDIDPAVPASILQLHSDCIFLVDREAAQYL